MTLRYDQQGGISSGGITPQGDYVMDSYKPPAAVS